MRKQLTLTAIILLIFLGAGVIAFLVKERFQPSCYLSATSDNRIQFEAQFNEKFVANEYTEIKDLGKSFLSLLVAVFVASITFSEKIVVYNTSSWWAKALLIACWILLLLSVVLAGAGMVFLASCYNQALHMPCPENVELYATSFFSFVIAGLLFGLGLTSMLCAGIVSFIHPPEKNEK